MKPIGKVSFYTHDGKLVIRGGEVPSIYAPVVTKDSKPIGKVHDVIGPVSNPYIIVKPAENGLKTKEDLFVTFQKKKRRKAGGKYRAGGKKG
ncbi:MAG: H/ACA RNA-protein complex protein Gar1 [Euryarchaeota archaeon]|nr:H/ACA RNA-protein complex protein Gar1 [Euryarchaeota archaeon]